MFSQLYKPESKLDFRQKKLIADAENAAKEGVDSLNMLYSLGRRQVEAGKTVPEDCVSVAADREVYAHDLGFMIRKGYYFQLLECENAKIPISLVTGKLTPLADGKVITLIGKKGSYPVRIKRLK